MRSLLIFLFCFLPNPLWAESLPNHPNWYLESMDTEGESRRFVLRPADGREGLTINARTATLLRTGELSPEAVYRGDSAKTDAEEYVYGGQKQSYVQEEEEGSKSVASGKSQPEHPSPSSASGPSTFSSTSPPINPYVNSSSSRTNPSSASHTSMPMIAQTGASVAPMIGSSSPGAGGVSALGKPTEQQSASAANVAPMSVPVPGGEIPVGKLTSKSVPGGRAPASEPPSDPRCQAGQWTNAQAGQFRIVMAPFCRLAKITAWGTGGATEGADYVFGIADIDSSTHDFVVTIGLEPQSSTKVFYVSKEALPTAALSADDRLLTSRGGNHPGVSTYSPTLRQVVVETSPGNSLPGNAAHAERARAGEAGFSGKVLIRWH